MFEKQIVNIDIKYLWNVYIFKINNLASLEIILGNNMLDGESLILLSSGLNNLIELRWIQFDLTGNLVDSISFVDISNNLDGIHQEC